MRVPFGFIFIMKTIFETYTRPSGFPWTTLSIKASTCPPQSYIWQWAHPSFYSKGQAVKIIFCSSLSGREEQSSNTQQHKQRVSAGESTAPAQEGIKSQFSQTPLPFKGPRKWLPEASLVTTPSSSQTRLGIVNSQPAAGPAPGNLSPWQPQGINGEYSLHCSGPGLQRSPHQVITK